MNDEYHKHWQTSTIDPHMKEIFEKPPLVAFKQPPNIKKCSAMLNCLIYLFLKYNNMHAFYIQSNIIT